MTSLVICLLIAGMSAIPEEEYIYDESPAMTVRINYAVHCHYSHIFHYCLLVREMATKSYNVLFEDDGYAFQTAKSSFFIPDREPSSGVFYEEYELYLFSNCSSDGQYRFNEPVGLERCADGTCLCELRVYFIIFTKWTSHSDQHLIYVTHSDS